MGFGLLLLFVFVIVPLTIILLTTWFLTNKKIFGQALGVFWLCILGFVFIGSVTQWLTQKTNLERKDYHGQYIINRDYFPGKQTDWQYNNFRFEIKENDSLYFYVMDKEKIVKTYRGVIQTPKTYNSARLILNMEQPTHHIINDNPTIYRSAWNFYLVFYSPKFSNVYFKKGQWKVIDE